MGEGGRGYRSSSCPLKGIALYGGIAEIVSPIAVSWATKIISEEFRECECKVRGRQKQGGTRITLWPPKFIPGQLRVSMATPGEPRGEKKLFLVQILGGEKLLEQCR